MAIKDLLIAYRGFDSSDAALDAALFIRDEYDAQLTGQSAQDFAPVRPSVGAWIPEDVRHSIRQAQLQATKKIEARFKQRIASNSAPDKPHWISKTGEGDATVARYARLFDVTVVGRRDAVRGDDDQLHPDILAMVSGRPVLPVPREFDMSTINEHAVLAWDGSFTCARRRDAGPQGQEPGDGHYRRRGSLRGVASGHQCGDRPAKSRHGESVS